MCQLSRWTRPAASGRRINVVQDGDVARQVAKALAGLPERQRGAIALVHYWGLPGRAALIEEAADLIGAKL